MGVCMLEGKDANQVHHQASNGYGQKAMRMNVWRIKEPLRARPRVTDKNRQQQDQWGMSIGETWKPSRLQGSQQSAREDTHTHTRARARIPLRACNDIPPRLPSSRRRTQRLETAHLQTHPAPQHACICHDQ